MAKRFFITDAINTLEFDSIHEWGYPRHKHNFFELTFILKGKGKHILNESSIDYNEGDVFFLTPKDEHEFVITEPTRFGLIKFTEQLFLEKANSISNRHWRKNIDTVIFYSNVIPKSIISNKKDSSQLLNLYYLIKNELENHSIYGREVLLELFGALLIILSRNLKSSLKSVSKNALSEEEKIDNILSYIRQNVLNKDRIKIKAIANEFCMSPNYISIFIKKHAGISIQQYAIQTKIRMAERLLKQTSLNISEITAKIGFTDSSHFNRIFKKYTGKNPSEYS